MASFPCVPCEGRGRFDRKGATRICRACVGTGRSMGKAEREARARDNATAGRLIGRRLPGGAR